MTAFNGFSKVMPKFFQNLKKNNTKHYKRIPRDCDPDHQNAEFLRFNGLHAMAEEKLPGVFYSEALVDYAFSHYKNMLPLHQWLKRAVDN